MSTGIVYLFAYRKDYLKDKEKYGKTGYGDFYIIVMVLISFMIFKLVFL